MAINGVVRYGMARHGAAWQGGDWLGYGDFGPFLQNVNDKSERLVSAGHGSVRHGRAWSGKVRQGRFVRIFLERTPCYLAEYHIGQAK